MCKTGQMEKLKQTLLKKRGGGRNMENTISGKKHSRYHIRKYTSILLLLLVTEVFMGMAAQAEDIDNYPSGKVVHPNRWGSSVTFKNKDDLRIAVHDGENINTITKGFRDHKPVWSKNGDSITFIRVTGDTDQKKYNQWRSKVCVIKADGTEFKELTDDSQPCMNPTWTKDGSNRIIFNQLLKSGLGIKFFWILPDEEKNSAERISSPYFVEWAECGLSDGRILMWRLNRFAHLLTLSIPFWTVPQIQKSYAFDPIKKKYTPINRSGRYPWHRLNFSSSGKKVTYMKDLDGNLSTYIDCVIAYAEFDPENLTVSNEVVITKESKDYTNMYPKWGPDEQFILFSSDRNGKMLQYAYSIESGDLRLVSNAELSVDMYASFEKLPN